MTFVIVGIFATKDILPKDAGKDSLISTTLRELVIYAAFVVLVSISKFISYHSEQQHNWENSIIQCNESNDVLPDQDPE